MAPRAPLWRDWDRRFRKAVTEEELLALAREAYDLSRTDQVPLTWALRKGPGKRRRK